MSIQKIEIGDCREVIKKYPDNFFDCLVTSPPYYHMRNYNTPPLIYGGNPNCNHQWIEKIHKGEGGTAAENTAVGANRENEANNRGGEGIKYWTCHCGAFRGELGWEPTPEAFVRNLIEVFETIRPKIKDIGSIWVNLGDKWIDLDQQLIPERFALGMKEKKWILINKITWIKPNSMPQSVKRRLSRTSELIFHFVKNRNYWYDLDAVREPNKIQTLERYQRAVNLGSFAVNTKYDDSHPIGVPRHAPKWFIEGVNKEPHQGDNPHRALLYEGKFTGMGENSEQFGSPRARDERLEKKEIANLGHSGLVDRDKNRELRDKDAYIGKNPGDTWEINTQSYTGTHFAVFPLGLVRIPIFTTCPPHICKKCGKPRERITETMTLNRTAMNGKGNGELSDDNFGSSVHHQSGWIECDCHSEYDAGWVLDPFAGSGTTLEFCRQNNRNAVGIELNENYRQLAVKRAKLDEPPIKSIKIQKMEIL